MAGCVSAVARRGSDGCLQVFTEPHECCAFLEQALAFLLALVFLLGIEVGPRGCFVCDCLQFTVDDGDLLGEVGQSLRGGADPLLLLRSDIQLCPFLDLFLDDHGGILGAGKIGGLTDFRDGTCAVEKQQLSGTPDIHVALRPDVYRFGRHGQRPFRKLVALGSEDTQE